MTARPRPQAGGRHPRIGLFGGTFDPPHLGHLRLAEEARESLALDRVVFIPARVPPHKRSRRVSPPAVRLRLLRAALRGTGFRIDTLELGRRGPSYTVETLELLHARHPRAEFFLLAGADSLRDLPTWREPDRILELAVLAVARRPGVGAARNRLPAAWRRRIAFLDNPPLDVASSDLRARIAAGRSIRFLVPAAVERLVSRLGLYRCRGGAR
jgi:nicotinate-nucleotide adenylyltransferase